MGCEVNEAHGRMPDESAPCNHVKTRANKTGTGRICDWCDEDLPNETSEEPGP